MLDIVLPRGNEAELIEAARELDWTGLYLAYREPKELPTVPGFETRLALLDPKAPARLKGKGLILSSASAEAALASPAELVFGLESHAKRDPLTGRASGLNPTLARFAAQRQKRIGFALRTIIEASNRPMLFGRIAQNIVLCQKAKVKMALFSLASEPAGLASPADLASLFRLLGMTRPRDAFLR